MVDGWIVDYVIVGPSGVNRTSCRFQQWGPFLWRGKINIVWFFFFFFFLHLQFLDKMFLVFYYNYRNQIKLSKKDSFFSVLIQGSSH